MLGYDTLQSSMLFSIIPERTGKNKQKILERPPFLWFGWTRYLFWNEVTLFLLKSRILPQPPQLFYSWMPRAKV